MSKRFFFGMLSFVLVIITACSTKESKKEFTVNGVTFAMVNIEGGTFTMGADDELGCQDNEKPEHSVTVDNFLIGETEVTQELWSAVMGNNPSGFKNSPLHPVESVNWFECCDFIAKLNELTGENFRMPTEAEWEYAARGGNKSKGFLYCGSDSIGDVAWYNDNSENITHPVKEKQPNELGLYDMSGNVWEWCNDWFGEYPAEAVINPTGPQSGHNRVMRGGSWLIAPALCRPADRDAGSPKGGGCIVGLRLAM